MLQNNSSSSEIHSYNLSNLFQEIKEDVIVSDESSQLIYRKSSPVDLGCEPKNSLKKKSDRECVKRDGAGSLHILELNDVRPPSATTSSSMLDESIPSRCTPDEVSPNYPRVGRSLTAGEVYKIRWGIPLRMRLAGGVDSSTSGNAGPGSPTNAPANGSWTQGGTPNGNPPANNTSHPANAATNNVSSPSSQNSGTATGTTSWAQAAGKNLPPQSPNGEGGSPASTPTTNGAMEQPNSPTGSTSSANGTNSSKQQIEDLKSLRDSLFSQDGWGGQHVNQDSTWDVPASPEPPGAKEPVAATAGVQPATPVTWKPNVNNGTELWEANLKNGGQPPPQAAKVPWGHTPTNNIGGTWGEDDDVEDMGKGWNEPLTTNSNQAQQWGGGAPNANPMWGNKKDDWGGSGWNDPRSNGMDPRMDQPHMRGVMDHRYGNESMMRGDPRNMSGRHNGSMNDQMWGGMPPNQPPGPGPHHHVNPSGPPPVPPSAASKMMPTNGPGSVAHWKEMAGVGNGMGRSGMPSGPGMSQRMNSSLNAAAVAGMKPDQLWGHRNGWSDNGPHDMNSWGEEKNPWDDPGMMNSWNQKPKNPMMPGWIDGEDPTWPHTKMVPNPKNLTKEMVYASKQFRILSEMNFKKEDVENALRASNMNLEDALEYLNATRSGSMANNIDAWRRPNLDTSPYDHNNQPFPAHRFNPHLYNMPPQSRGTPNQQPTAQQLRTLVQQIQMAVTAGYLNHQILNQPLAPQTLLLMNNLLQQIKLLQQLQQQTSQSTMFPGQPKGPYLTLNVKQQQCKQNIQNLQSQIITTQALYMKQTQHVPGHQQGGMSSDYYKPQPDMAMLPGFSELSISKEHQMPTAAAGFQHESKLSQWKMPTSMDKDDLNEFSRAPGTTAKTMSTSGSPNLNPIIRQNDGAWSNAPSRMETGWPESMNEMQDNKDWASSSVSSNFNDLVPEFEPGKPWKGTQIKSVEDDPTITPGSIVRSSLTMAPIKESGDMYQGGATVISEKTSPTAEMGLTPLTIPSSSTWSFNPACSTSSFTSPLGKISGNGSGGGAAKANWGDVGATADIWNVPKSRCPPPGLTASNKSSGQLVGGGGAANSNGWASLGSPRWPSNAQSPWMGGGGGGSGGSSWLQLKNLTPQIDGSTLKTLCMQHGPLSNFHLFLSNGIALAKYNSRDEASKAQCALNSCVLGNTTIFAESPADSEVHAMLQQLNQQSASGSNWSRGGGGNGANGGAPPKPNGAAQGDWNAAGGNQLWPSTLWGAPAAMEGQEQRATPSGMNSFMPNDLLGGESM